MKHQLERSNNLGDIRRLSINRCTYNDIKRLFDPGEPFIINDLIQTSNAFHNWDLDYLIKKISHRQISYVPLDKYMMTSYETKQTTSFLAFSKQLQNFLKPNGGTKKSITALYLVVSRIMAHPAARSVQLPELLKDIEIPFFIPFHKLWEINLWIGAGRNKSNLHFDPEENLLSMIKGYKKIVLFQPSYSKYLYQVNDKNGNTLQSRVNLFDIDSIKYPDITFPKYYETIIYPGDTLYIPPGWWHAVESSLELNIAVNINWLPSIKYLFRFTNPARKYFFNHSSKLYKYILYSYRR